MLHLLDLLSSLREEFQLEHQVMGDSIEQLNDSGVVVRRLEGRLILAVNFAKELSLSLPQGLGRPVVHRGVKHARLAPLGFGLWLR